MISRSSNALPWLPGLLALLLVGCSSDNSTVWTEYFQMMQQSVKGSFGDSGITRSQAAAIPYASLGYRINAGREGILVLATDTNGDQLWTAASHVVLLTRGGRIVQTVGLPKNISNMTPVGGPVLPPLSDALRGPYRSTRTMDMPDSNTYGVILSCITSSRGPKSITIIGTKIATVQVDETCRSLKPIWTFTDNYWIDASTGFVWHSVQHIHPAGVTVQTEIFRPPG